MLSKIFLFFFLFDNASESIWPPKKGFWNCNPIKIINENSHNVGDGYMKYFCKPQICMLLDAWKMSFIAIEVREFKHAHGVTYQMK